MAAKKKTTTKKTGAGQQRSPAKRSPAKKKPVQKEPAQKQAVQRQPVQEPETQPVAKKAPAKKTTEKAAKQLSALDAAARVLAESDQPMNCREMIEAMAEKGYWTSLAGKTPSATLYSAILRELKAKGESARFQKVERGRFALAQDVR